MLGMAEPVRAGAWINMDDESQIRSVIDETGEDVEFVFLGPAELGINMSIALLTRFRDIVSEACEKALHLQAKCGDE